VEWARSTTVTATEREERPLWSGEKDGGGQGSRPPDKRSKRKKKRPKGCRCLRIKRKFDISSLSKRKKTQRKKKKKNKHRPSTKDEEGWEPLHVPRGTAGKKETNIIEGDHRFKRTD